MYNRYIRNDQGSYSRIPTDDAPPVADAFHESPPPEDTPPRRDTPPPPHWETPPPTGNPKQGDNGITGYLRRLLDRFHLENVDTGDLLLLLLLFFLFEEDADSELLIALGLLLIL
ncbi:MAG: hypothetical protein RR092_02990 [Oscillospiraceae bacterium]